MPLHELLYVSERAPAMGLRRLRTWIERARLRHVEAGVTGALAFDGHRFAGLLEGEKDVVHAAAACLAEEPLHVGYRVLHAGPRRGPRRFDGWSLVWLIADHLADEALPRISSLQGPEAVQALLACLGDLRPPGPMTG